MSLAMPAQVPVSIGLSPNGPQGARMAGPINLAWTLTAGLVPTSPPITDDLILEGEDGTINNIQTIFFDNSSNAGTVYMTIGDTQQLLVFPAHSQGYLPVMATNSLRYSAFNYGGGIGTSQCNISFLNVPVAPHVWASPSNMQNTPLKAVTVQNGGNTVISLPCFSGTITPPNKSLYIYGIEVTGTGATAEGFITLTLSQIQLFPTDISAHNYQIGFDVPILGSGGVNIQRSFNPPFKAATALNAQGYITTNPILTVPAMGAGQTGAGAAIYYTLD